MCHSPFSMSPLNSRCFSLRQTCSLLPRMRNSLLPMLMFPLGHWQLLWGLLNCIFSIFLPKWMTLPFQMANSSCLSSRSVSKMQRFFSKLQPGSCFNVKSTAWQCYILFILQKQSFIIFICQSSQAGPLLTCPLSIILSSSLVFSVYFSRWISGSACSPSIIILLQTKFVSYLLRKGVFEAVGAMVFLEMHRGCSVLFGWSEPSLCYEIIDSRMALLLGLVFSGCAERLEQASWLEHRVLHELICAPILALVWRSQGFCVMVSYSSSHEGFSLIQERWLLRKERSSCSFPLPLLILCWKTSDWRVRLEGAMLGTQKRDV